MLLGVTAYLGGLRDGALGGWSDPQTGLRCYQRPDEQTMRWALEARRVVNRE